MTNPRRKEPTGLEELGRLVTEARGRAFPAAVVHGGLSAHTWGAKVLRRREMPACRVALPVSLGRQSVPTRGEGER